MEADLARQGERFFEREEETEGYLGGWGLGEIGEGRGEMER